MGRKPAPQPLALSDRSALGASQNVAAETHSSTIPSTSSPISSKSPTSPRSPFRFIQEKSPSLISKSYNPAPGKITSRSQTTSPSPLSSSVAPPQVQEQQQIPPAEISASKVTHLEGKTADEEEEQEEEEEEKEEYYQPTSIDEAIHKSLSSTAASPVPLIVQDSSAPFLTAQSTPVAPVGQAARHTPSDARQRRLQDSEEALGAAATVSAPSTPAGKHSKSGGGGGGKFFSHFSRPSHQHNSSTPPKHPPSPQGGESTSKDSDRRTIPGSAHGKSSKKSGTAETFIIGRLSTPWETTPESCTHLAAEMVSSQGEALHSTLTSNHAENAIAARTAIAEGPCPDSMITRANDEDAGATKKRLRTCQVLPSRRPRPVRQKLAPTKKLSRLLHDRGARPPGTAGCDVTTPPSSPTKYVVSNMLTLSLSIDQCFQKSLSLRQQNPSKSDLSIASNAEIDAPASSAASTPAKRSKPKPFALLNRSRSNRDKDASAPQDNDLLAPPTARLADPERTQRALRTAPVAHERTFRDMMNSAVRNRSEDRNGQSHSRETSTHREEKHSRTQPSSFKENSGFLSNLRNSSRTAADMFSKGLFGKSARSAGTNEKEPVVDDEHYVLKVINLPLIEQTRLTRISKRLEDSRDKTEFWMPAFPWRAIDYLNFKGCEVEGLYRVPGSGPQVKRWQRKFDEEYDVDLFAQDDLYDINIVGSMLKAWLRELPDELLPKDVQERVAHECAGSETVPEMLIEELSKLPPFHYYLLFAITCHLSLLLAHSDKNKMDFRNLCICFQPCMKIDAFCFKFLVCDWRNCWRGCQNEAKYIEEEYTLFDQPPPPSINEPRKKGQQKQQQEQQEVQMQKEPQPQQDNSVIDNRTVSSSDSKQSAKQDNHKNRLKKKGQAHSESNGSVASHSTISTTLTVNSEREAPAKQGQLTLRPLSPIKPLSPLEF